MWHCCVCKRELAPGRFLNQASGMLSFAPFGGPICRECQERHRAEPAWQAWADALAAAEVAV